MLKPFDVTPDPFLLFCGNIVGPLSDFDIAGKRDNVAHSSIRERLRHVWWSNAWRECAPNTCVHPQFGVCVPLATDGIRVAIWTGSESALVHKVNILGPVVPHLQDIADWNWETNMPKVRIAPDWLRDAQAEQDRLDGMFIAGAISHPDYCAACERIVWTKPKTRRARGVELAMELLNSLSK